MMSVTVFAYLVRLVHIVLVIGGSSPAPTAILVLLLGFSRGAYTARALAGMLSKV